MDSGCGPAKALIRQEALEGLGPAHNSPKTCTSLRMSSRLHSARLPGLPLLGVPSIW